MNDLTSQNHNATKNPQPHQLSLIQQHHDHIYPQQPYRLVNLVLYLIATIASTLPYQTYTAISTQMVQIYGYSKIMITLNGLMYPIVHPTFSFVANLILDKYSLKTGFIICGITCIIGTWIRSFIAFSIYPSLFGSFLTAFGTIFIVNSPAKFSNTWFKPSIVPTIISIIIIIGYFASSLSVLFPIFFINDDSTKQDVSYMLLIQSTIITITMLVFMIFYKANPNVPPSYAAAAVKPSTNYAHEMKTLFTNRNYIFLLLSNGASYSTFVAIITDIQYSLSPFFPKNTSSIASQSLLLACVFGLIGCLVFTNILKRTKKFKLILIFLMSVATMAMLLLILVLKTKILWLSYINMIMIGFFMIPITPIVLQFGCQLAFPVGQASSSGYLYAAGQLLGFCVGLGLIAFLDGISEWRSNVGLLILSILNLSSVIFLLFIKEDLRRTNYQSEQMKLNDENDSELVINDNEVINKE